MINQQLEPQKNQEPKENQLHKSNKNSKQKKQPAKYKHPKFKFNQTQQCIAKLEEKLSSKIICYYTHPESSIHQSHPDLFFDHLHKIGEQEELILVIISNGGWSVASLRIATIIREYCKKLTVIIPSVCASAATNLALSADKIIMSPAGYLTAIDSTLRHSLNPKNGRNEPTGVSVDQVKRVLKFLNEEGPAKNENGVSEGSYRTLFKYLHPLALGEIDRYSSASELIATKMMKMHSHTFESEEQIEAIAKHLVNDYPLHAFPILFKEAQEIGLPVHKADKDTYDILWKLTKNYDLAGQSAITNLTPDYYHFEWYPVMIESNEIRTAHEYWYNRRFNKVTKKWWKENDNTQWVNITNSQSKPGSIRISSIDVLDSETNVPAKMTDNPESPNMNALNSSNDANKSITSVDNSTPSTT